MKKNIYEIFIITIFLMVIVLAMSLVFSIRNSKTESNNITLFLLWEPQAQFTGYYVAQDLGFFEENGINISIQHNLGVGESLQQLKNNKNTFVITQYVNYLDWLSKDPNLELLSIINKGCNLGWSANKLSKIEEFKMALSKNDLYSWWGPKDLLLKAFLIKNGFSIENLSARISTQYPKNLSNDLVALAMSYNEATELNSFKSNINITHTSYCKLGFPIFEDVLVGSSMSGMHNETSLKVVQSIWRGWDWAIKNTDAAIDIVMKRNPRRTNRQDQKKMLNIFLSNITKENDSINQYKEVLDTSNEIIKLFDSNSATIAKEHLNLIMQSNSLRNQKSKDNL